MRVRPLRAWRSRPPERAAVLPAWSASGETTVRVKGTGLVAATRNSRLRAAEVITDARSSMVLASIGTDGIDGPTDAAGAIVDNSTVDRLAARRAVGAGRPR